MLASARNLLQQNDFVILVVAVCILAAIETRRNGTAVDNHIEGVESRKQTLRARHQIAVVANIQLLDFGRFLASQRGRRDPEESLVSLVTDNQTAFRIRRQANPRAKFLFGDSKQSFDLEIRKQIEKITGSFNHEVGEDPFPARVIFQCTHDFRGIKIFCVP